MNRVDKARKPRRKKWERSDRKRCAIRATARAQNKDRLKNDPEFRATVFVTLGDQVQEVRQSRIAKAIEFFKGRAERQAAKQATVREAAKGRWGKL